MNKIKIEHHPDPQKLEALGVSEWGIWSKEVSEFPWVFDAEEVCYFLAGEVIVTPDDGEPVKMGAGDLVTFPQGMSCTWLIRQDVKKHYRFN